MFTVLLNHCNYKFTQVLGDYVAPPPLHCRTLRRTPVLKGPAVTVGPSVEAPTNCRLR